MPDPVMGDDGRVRRSEYTDLPSPPINVFITSPYTTGTLDIIFDNPRMLPENSKFNVVGVNVYRAFDSPEGPYEKLNLDPVSLLFYRDLPVNKFIENENVSARFSSFGSNERNDFIFHTINKPVVSVDKPVAHKLVPSFGGVPTNNINDINVTVNGTKARIRTLTGLTGEVCLLTYPFFDTATQKIVQPVIPQAGDTILASYYTSDKLTQTALNQRIYYKVASVTLDGKETPLDRIEPKHHMDTNRMSYIWREAVRRNRWILQQGGERVLLFMKKRLGRPCAPTDPESLEQYHHTVKDCLFCYGTGIIGGYEGPIEIEVGPPASSKSLDLTEVGVHLNWVVDSWTGPTPLINQRDFIVRKDGCFPYETRVLLADGSYKFIGEIVERRLSGPVLSYNTKTGQLEQKEILNWFNNGYKPLEEWTTLQTVSGKSRAVRITNNHTVYVQDKGFLPVSDLTLSSTVLKVSKFMNATQWQVLYGMFLGDGAFRVEKRPTKFFSGEHGYSFQIMQSDSQKFYFEKKLGLFQDLMGRVVVGSSGYGSLMWVSTSRLSFELKSFFGDNFVERGDRKTRKKVTKGLLKKLDPLGFAVWFMDDGSRNPDKTDFDYETHVLSAAMLSTHGFENAEVDEIASFFQERGYTVSALEGRGGKYIRIRSEDSQRFFEMIAPYVLEEFDYKLPVSLRGGKKIQWWLDSALEIGVYPAPIVCMRKMAKNMANFSYKKVLGKRYYRAYDLQIEGNSCYFAENLLVHNSRMLISAVTPIYDGGVVLQQEFSMEYMDESDIRYKVPVNIPMIDGRPIFGSGFVAEKSEVEDTREVKGRTRTFRNITY